MSINKLKLYFYKTSLLSYPLDSLTYSSSENIKIGSLVEVILNNKQRHGVIISECKEPDFDTIDIVGISDLFYSPQQIQLAQFISTYYICSLGDALGLMVGFNTSILIKSHRFSWHNKI